MKGVKICQALHEIEMQEAISKNRKNNTEFNFWYDCFIYNTQIKFTKRLKKIYVDFSFKIV